MKRSIVFVLAASLLFTNSAVAKQDQIRREAIACISQEYVNKFLTYWNEENDKIAAERLVKNGWCKYIYEGTVVYTYEKESFPSGWILIRIPGSEIKLWTYRGFFKAQ